MYVGRIVELADDRRALHRAQASRTPRPCCRPCPSRTRARARGDHAPRGGGEPRLSAQRLLLPPSLPVRDRRVPDAGAGLARDLTRRTSSPVTAPVSSSSPAWDEVSPGTRSGEIGNFSAGRPRAGRKRAAPPLPSRRAWPTRSPARPGLRARECREAAIAAGDHALAADDLGVADDALGDQLGMLDEVRRRIEHAGDDQPCRRAASISRNTAHSCSWRGLAPSNESACGRARSATGRISRSGMSRWCGPS